MDIGTTSSVIDDIFNYFKQQKLMYGSYIFNEEIDSQKKIFQEEPDIKKEKILSITMESTSDALFEDYTPVQNQTKEDWENSLTIEELYSKICNCKKCPLGLTRNKFVFGVGNPNADIMFIGEAPGADEDKQGEPFVGRAGQLFNKILEAIKWKREAVYICNILKCRPPNNRDPLISEAEICELYLKKQIELVKPIIMISLGRIAAQTILRKPNDSLSVLRSKAHLYHGIPLYATFHPAALLRNPNWKPDTWEDFKKFKSIYDNATNKKLK